MKVLDIFSGIGGFSLGLEAAGMTTVAFCEIEPYCRAVLNKHWPTTRIYSDVRKLTAAQLQRDGIAFDVICGGFPCQDISLAGKGAGLAGKRSGLWSQYRRLIEECRPAWAIIENVSILRARGLETILGQLASLRYDAEWYCIPASAVGAPHRRDRLWLVAYPHDAGLERRPRLRGYLTAQLATIERGGSLLADTARLQSGWPKQRPERERVGTSGKSVIVANAESDGRQPRRARNATQESRRRQLNRSGIGANDVAVTNEVRHESQSKEVRARRDSDKYGGWWLTEPNVGRVANGVPARVDRLRSLGNAVVPQIPEMIGRAILAYERRAA